MGRVEGDEATLGITWYAQDALGELVHFEPPQEGDSVAKDESYGEGESVKAVSELTAPRSGKIIAVNAKVINAPDRQRGSLRRSLARPRHPAGQIRGRRAHQCFGPPRVARAAVTFGIEVPCEDLKSGSSLVYISTG